MRKFRPFAIDQNYLLPPDVNEWLSQSHLARFLRTLVNETLDLTPIRSSYETKTGQGAPPYDPAMMMVLLVYAYCIGLRSSRRIEAATYDDLGLRYLTGNQHPDHDSIAAFRKRHLADFESLFGQVLSLCVGVGLLKAGVIDLYVDGTKMRANASRQQTFTHSRLQKTEEQLQGEASKIVQEAKQVDAAEDDLYGPGKRGGGDVPEYLADPDALRKKLKAVQQRQDKVSEARQQMEKEAREQAEQQVAEAQVRHDEHRQEKKSGRVPLVPDIDELTSKLCQEKRVNLTDPDSRLMKDGATKAIVQGYNCQAVAAKGSQVIVACDVTQEANDLHQLAPMAELASSALKCHGLTTDVPCRLGADSGYLTTADVDDSRVAPFDLYIAPGSLRGDGSSREICGEQEPPRIGGFVKYTEEPKPLSPFATLQVQMGEKIASEAGSEFYKGRSTTIEPIFGQTKENRGIRRLMLRGVWAAKSEWALICATHNLLKIFRHQNSPVQKSAAENPLAQKTTVENGPGQKPSRRLPERPRSSGLRRSCVWPAATSLELGLGMG